MRKKTRSANYHHHNILPSIVVQLDCPVYHGDDDDVGGCGRFFVSCSWSWPSFDGSDDVPVVDPMSTWSSLSLSTASSSLSLAKWFWLLRPVVARVDTFRHLRQRMDNVLMMISAEQWHW